MSKELEALDGLAQFIIMNDTGTDESASAIEWHNTLKQAITDYEQLQRDVARYFELQYKNQFDRMTQNEIHEMYVLREKLLKVGKGE